jgi:hypothetical protein
MGSCVQGDHQHYRRRSAESGATVKHSRCCASTSTKALPAIGGRRHQATAGGEKYCVAALASNYFCRRSGTPSSVSLVSKTGGAEVTVGRQRCSARLHKGSRRRAALMERSSSSADAWLLLASRATLSFDGSPEIEPRLTSTCASPAGSSGVALAMRALLVALSTTDDR